MRKSWRRQCGLWLDLVVLMLQDDACSMFWWKQATDGFGDFGTTFGIQVSSLTRVLITREVPAWRPLRGWCRRLNTLFGRAASSWSQYP
jgi:hypothetical protein